MPSVNVGQLEELHHIDTAVPALTLRHEIRRPPHHRGHLMLGQTGFFARRDQTLHEGIVGLLKPGSPCLA